ncbi:MAG: hypothetical protein ACJA08_003584 [Cyclobacteriaceae bacterium]|jgi:hypothetical protein
MSRFKNFESRRIQNLHFFMRYLVFILAIILFQGCVQLNPTQPGTQPISHQLWNDLLLKHVTKNGLVNYEDMKSDSLRLQAYLKLLSDNAPSETWSREEKLAYWINTYNAFTIALVLDHYPIGSIKDICSSIQIPFINSPWDIEFIEIAGETYDLNNLEHNILRQNWDEPRIHFAINCASFSCSQLRNEAYSAENLDTQLNEQAIAFINDDFRNDIDTKEAQLSKIFQWFSGDFEKNGTLRDFVNQYSDQKIIDGMKISYKDYDWRLNTTGMIQ